MNRKFFRSLTSPKAYSILAVLLLVIVMYTAAGSLSQKEIIFPELAALAVGTWILGNRRWLRQPLLICLSPTLAAVTGIIIVHFLSHYQVVAILLAFVAVSIELAMMRSHVTPSISAAILPIFLQIDSLYYPLAVGVLTAIIAFSQIRFRIEQAKPLGSLLTVKEKSQVSKVLPVNRKLFIDNKDFLIWFGIFMGLILITLFAFFIHWQFIVAPPLIVAFVEITQHREGISGQRFKLLLLIGCSAIWGTLSMEVLHNRGHFPLVIVAACSVIGVLILFQFLKLSFPPAMALALLPTIIPREFLRLYFIQVFIGAFLFIVLSWFYSFCSQDLIKNFKIS